MREARSRNSNLSYELGELNHYIHKTPKTRSLVKIFHTKRMTSWLGEDKWSSWAWMFLSTAGDKGETEPHHTLLFYPGWRYLQYVEDDKRGSATMETYSRSPQWLSRVMITPLCIMKGGQHPLMHNMKANAVMVGCIKCDLMESIECFWGSFSNTPLGL